MKQLAFIQNKINEIINRKQLKTKPKIVVVSKNHPENSIKTAISYGIKIFGENKVQEAEKKWDKALVNKKNLKLHMVGKIQSNKARKAVEIFDYIHSIFYHSVDLCLLGLLYY